MARCGGSAALGQRPPDPSTAHPTRSARFPVDHAVGVEACALALLRRRAGAVIALCPEVEVGQLDQFAHGFGAGHQFAFV